MCQLYWRPSSAVYDEESRKRQLITLFLVVAADDKDTIRPPGMGRITGSASIETLVRVGIEKENGLSPDSKMIVLHDFTPCVDDELDVKRGNVSLTF
jgi:hypothetical protein